MCPERDDHYGKRKKCSDNKSVLEFKVFFLLYLLHGIRGGRGAKADTLNGLTHGGKVGFGGVILNNRVV